eukprot:EG_transcript_44802
MDLTTSKVIAVAALAGVAVLALLSSIQDRQAAYTSALPTAAPATGRPLQAVAAPQGTPRRAALATAGLTATGLALHAPSSALAAAPEPVPDFDKHVAVEVVQPGNGRDFPQRGQTVEVHYVGKLTNGVQFDSSRARGQ